MPTKLAHLLHQALDFQQAGATERAAELYAAVLDIDPDVADAHNMLGVIHVAQGHILNAFRHSRRAGELTGWSVQIINHNYSYVARMALANADAALAAHLGARCQKHLREMGQAADEARISVLLAAAGAGSALETSLARLARLGRTLHEVLVCTETIPESGSGTYPFTVRYFAPKSDNPYQHLNQLAGEANGDYLFALPPENLTERDGMSALQVVSSPVGTWCLALPDNPTDPRLGALFAESMTTGFVLLSGAVISSAGIYFLVPKLMHDAIGGFQSSVGDPWYDYGLRLLWNAEPAKVGYGMEPAALALRDLATSVSSDALNGYLEKVLQGELPLNEFAPSPAVWGLYFFAHLVSRSQFPRADLMERMNEAIEAYLIRKSARRIDPRPGLNLVGPARGEFGLAENMRAFARASLEGGIPCAIRDVNLALNTRQSDHSLLEHTAEDAGHNCSIFFLNPDARQLYDQSLDAVVFQRPNVDFRHLKIGYWFWELEKIPPQWNAAIDKVDEIWVATEFIARALRAVTDKPVIKIPTPISFQLRGQYERAYFNLPEKVFLFLFSFDFNSFAERKNPHGLIRAFLRAFPPHRRDVALVIKSINGCNKPGSVEALLNAADNDPRILLRDGFMSRDEVFGMQSVVDSYVSLHRAEGLGLGLAESMYQGKPVIGTGYSGNLEFMNEANSGLVDYSLVPIKKGEYLYDDPGFFWAEPDEDHAAFLMRRLADDAAYRGELALRGRTDILDRFSNAKAVEKINSRLKSIGIF